MELGIKDKMNISNATEDSAVNICTTFMEPNIDKAILSSN